MGGGGGCRWWIEEILGEGKLPLVFYISTVMKGTVSRDLIGPLDRRRLILLGSWAHPPECDRRVDTLLAFDWPQKSSYRPTLTAPRSTSCQQLPPAALYLSRQTKRKNGRRHFALLRKKHRERAFALEYSDILPLVCASKAYTLWVGLLIINRALAWGLKEVWWRHKPLPPPC